MTILKSIREVLNLSQVELGKKIGVSHNAIKVWEKNIASPKLSNLVQLQRLIGIDSTLFLDNTVDVTLEYNKLIYISRNNCSIKDIKTGKPYLVSLILDSTVEKNLMITLYNIEKNIKAKIKNDKGTWRFETLIYSSGNINMEILSKIIDLNYMYVFFEQSDEPVFEQNMQYQKAELKSINSLIKMEMILDKLELIEKFVKARKEALDE